MGLYWATMLYYGRLLSQEAYDKLKKDTAFGQENESDWITNTHDPRGRYILHSPNGLVSLNSMDPIMETHEIERGFIEWDDLVQAVARSTSSTIKDQFDKLTIDSLDPEIKNKLQAFVLSASPDDKPSDIFGKYLIEISWSTLDFPATPSGQVTKNIKVKRGGLQPPLTPPCHAPE